ncbi:general transcription factor II-I repeat domain-containing protein 2-like [Tachysurus ichikawai]
MGDTNAPVQLGSLSLLPSNVGATMFPNAHFADKLSALRTEFSRRFGDFEAQKRNFELLHNPFAVDVETAPVQNEMELIELQWNGTLKENTTLQGPLSLFSPFLKQCLSSVYMRIEPCACLVAHICVRSCSQ